MPKLPTTAPEPTKQPIPRYVVIIETLNITADDLHELLCKAIHEDDGTALFLLHEEVTDIKVLLPAVTEGIEL